MEKYEVIETLGDGAFGIVYKAIHNQTKEVVAIKEFKRKFYSIEECKNLREVKSLVTLQERQDHENLIKILEMIFTNDKTLYLVFTYMKENLYDVMKSRSIKKFSETQIKCIMHQVIKGIHYMHKYGFFHRDLKPENILVDGDLVKIADFGLAREIRSVPPYTDYVSTRWYRAPECLLKSTNYNSPVDIWALGCIMVELFNLKPIFPGNSEKEVLFKICGAIGVPNNSGSNKIITFAKKIDFKFPVNIQTPPLSSIIPDASKEALDIIGEMLQWDPAKRLTTAGLLAHPFFTSTSVPTRILTPDNEVFKKGKVFKKEIDKKQKEETKDQANLQMDDELNKFLESTQDFNDCKYHFKHMLSYH